MSKFIFYERDCLAYDPFDGDFGDISDKTLRDKITTVRKKHVCHLCASEINPGDTVRLRTDIFDGIIATYYWCFECCKAMAISWKDDGKKLEKRYANRGTTSQQDKLLDRVAEVEDAHKRAAKSKLVFKETKP